MLRSIAPTNGLAFAAFAMGCLSFLFAALTAIPGVICDHMTLGEHEADPSLLGKGWAVAGLWISWNIIIINIFSVIVVAIFWQVIWALFRSAN